MSEGQKKKDGRGCNTRGKARLGEWLIKRLDIPPELLSGGMRVELRGREYLMVEGCRRILTYTPTLVRLRLHRCVLAVEGERLLCQSYLSGAVTLEGWISGVCFEEDTGC